MEKKIFQFAPFSLHFNFQLFFTWLSSWALVTNGYRKTVAKQFHVIAFICARTMFYNVSERERACFKHSEWAEISFRGIPEEKTFLFSLNRCLCSFVSYLKSFFSCKERKSYGNVLGTCVKIIFKVQNKSIKILFKLLNRETLKYIHFITPSHDTTWQFYQVESKNLCIDAKL